MKIVSQVIQAAFMIEEIIQSKIQQLPYLYQKEVLDFIESLIAETASLPEQKKRLLQIFLKK